LWARTHDDDNDGGGGDGVAQHGDHTPKEVDRDIKLWFTVYFFDIGHQYYDQLTPIKVTRLLNCISELQRRTSLAVLAELEKMVECLPMY